MPPAPQRAHLRRLTVATAAAAAALLLAACGGGTGEASTPTTATPTTATPTTATPTTATPTTATPTSGTAGCTTPKTPVPAGLPTITSGAGFGETPTVTKGQGPPPTGLVVKDLVVGTGPTACASSTVTVNYHGTTWASGDVFDSSFGAQPATFPLQQLIKGWQEGIPGMKVGGRRMLVTPPALAYAGSGNPLQDQTLVFVIDLVAVPDGAAQ